MIDMILVWWLRKGRYTWSKFRRSIFERNSRRITLPNITTFNEIESSLGKVTWVADGPFHLYDAISFPETVWKHKKDDCDGFSVLAAALLKKWNSRINPVLITAINHPIQSSHTVCVFRSTDGALCYFDNAKFKPGPFESYDQIVSEITKKVKKRVCWDARDPVSFDLLEFHKSEFEKR